MVKVEKDYLFEGASGTLRLRDLFDNRHQLIVCHFMFDPDWDEGCPTCSFLVDNMPNPIHLRHARDTAPGLSVFRRQGERGYHTYSTYQRGPDLLLGTYNYLDLTPLGRQEDGPGPHEFRHHDRYAARAEAQR